MILTYLLAYGKPLRDLHIESKDPVTTAFSLNLNFNIFMECQNII
jgi:hypothetical protein